MLKNDKFSVLNVELALNLLAAFLPPSLVRPGFDVEVALKEHDAVKEPQGFVHLYEIFTCSKSGYDIFFYSFHFGRGIKKAGTNVPATD